MINMKSVKNRVGMIVFSLNQLAAACIAYTVFSRFLVFEVIRRTAGFADASAGHSAYDVLISNLDADYSVNGYAHCIKCLSLGYGSREAVKDETVCTVILCKTLLDDADNDIIGNKLSCIDKRFCLQAHFCAVGKGFTNDIACRYCRYFELCADDLSLCALTCTGCAEKNKFHN